MRLERSSHPVNWSVPTAEATILCCKIKHILFKWNRFQTYWNQDHFSIVMTWKR